MARRKPRFRGMFQRLSVKWRTGSDNPTHPAAQAHLAPEIWQMPIGRRTLSPSEQQARERHFEQRLEAMVPRIKHLRQAKEQLPLAVAQALFADDPLCGPPEGMVGSPEATLPIPELY